MEENRYTPALLDQIPQPGFFAAGGRILTVNQAAQALLLTPGQEIAPLLPEGCEEYAAFSEGQLCVSLTIGGQSRPAVITRMDDRDLFLLDPEEEQEELRSLALAAMEMRAPLMQAITSARQLPEGESAGKLNKSLMQMLRMVCNMSDVSRYAASSRMEVRDVDALLLELFEKAGTLIQGATVSYEGLGYPLFTRLDTEQLERSVWNILSNAIKFLPREGVIQAKLTRRGQMLHLTIEDNGSGVAEFIRSSLFHRYLRQPGIEDSRHGLGLGLALVRTAAANHGGTVLIHSTESGTRITMTLAIRPQEDTTLRCPILRPDYTGGWDHGLVELADSLGVENYDKL